jgi:hypothetical protein
VSWLWAAIHGKALAPALLHTILPGDRPPHAPRVSIRIAHRPLDAMVE